MYIFNLLAGCTGAASCFLLPSGAASCTDIIKGGIAAADGCCIVVTAVTASDVEGGVKNYA